MDNIKQNIADALAKVLEKDTKEILISIEKPKDSSMGDFAYPCFRLASVMKKAPMLIAEELKEKIGDISGVTDVQVVSGYLNFYADNNYVIETTLKEILTKSNQPMMIIYGYDSSQEIEAILFHKKYQEFHHLIKENIPIALTGYFKNDDNYGLSFIVNEVEEMEKN